MRDANCSVVTYRYSWSHAEDESLRWACSPGHFKRHSRRGDRVQTIIPHNSCDARAWGGLGSGGEQL